MRVSDSEKFEGRSIFYSLKDLSLHHGQGLMVLGGGDSALNWVLNL